MRAAPHQPSSYLDTRGSLRSRALSLLLALAITAGIVALLIGLGALPVGKPVSQPALVTLQLPGLGTRASSTPRTARAKQAPPARARPTPAPPSRAPSSRSAIPSTPAPWNVIPMTGAEFAASDIRSMPTHHEERQTAQADDQGGGAPAGDRIVYAQLLREPTPAELSAYRPRVMRDGWGEIECRLNEHRRLEDCKEISETPGSGYSRMMRLAAWEFVIAPTRVNGKDVVGMTVRVRYDFTGFDKDAAN